MKKEESATNLAALSSLSNWKILFQLFYYSTVTDLAKFLGLSTSNPLFFEI